VRSVVAVASGKGGVGKSTVAVNLAVARAGHRTGLLDADIYGPSLPWMLGLSRKPEVRLEKMIPLGAWGLSCMSIGFLEETPMIWRGPMVMGALEQMIVQVEGRALDILVVDMPPAPAMPSSPWRGAWP
jgi:ATP-binding protein involved in chromosome partitioning